MAGDRFYETKPISANCQSAQNSQPLSDSITSITHACVGELDTGCLQMRGDASYAWASPIHFDKLDAGGRETWTLAVFAICAFLASANGDLPHRFRQ
jgi:hypothetical protein